MNLTQIPAPRVPVVDPATGLMSREWFRFFNYLYEQLGGGSNYTQNSADVSYNESGTGAVTRSVQSKLQESVSVEDFGAVGDGVTDDTAAFQLAINHCAANTVALYIPEGNYLFSNQLVVNNAFDITCDRTATMRWTSSITAQCGIVFNFTNAGVSSLCNIDLPNLYGSAINSLFQIPNYGPINYTYNLNSRAGNGITLIGGNRINLNVQYLSGWESAILVKSTLTFTVANVNINVNTSDFNVNGIYIASPIAANVIQALVYTTNTCWAKYPIYIDTTNLSCIASKFSITGQAITNETGGCIIYQAGTAFNSLDTCEFDINWAFAGYGLDSTTGVSTSLICPFIGGDGASNGVTYDGNSPNVGYFYGKYCELKVGLVMGVGGAVAGGSAIPVAGNTIRVRDAGTFNLIRMKNTDNIATSPIAVTATIGETNYNGGIGGAQYSNKVYCSANVPILSSLNGVAFYLYHQCVTANQTKPIKVYARDSSLIAKNLQIVAYTSATSNNRQITIEIFNMSTTSPTTAGIVNFWVELP